MIIISDCVKDKADEGCIKVASSLAQRLSAEGHYVISTNENSSFSNTMIKTNRIFSNRSLYKEIKNRDGNILYIPFASNTLGSAIRIFFLALKSRRKVNVLFALRWNMNAITKFIIKISHCNIISLSEESHNYFSEELPNKCINLRTGVDCSKFVPVDFKKKQQLRAKYNIPKDRKVLLHAGHLKHGRNIDAFLDVPDEYMILLIFSSVTDKEENLRKRLLARDNVRVIEEYIPNVEELFQLSDVYVFPVADENNSIDVPISVLEAAGCNIPILSTPYKEIKYFNKSAGLFIKNYSSSFFDELNDVISCECVTTREIAEEYDWAKSVKELCEIID